ncbi:uncharacterized protein STEHIDRAFT_124042 [Stereum hirsutum FP-91666 SS1]|uniref:uncharacterized protein n=1 Tax=Stereum hirsutum (strain FP-91666) TaxID=721885 RepID=UPI0004449597|nr:uncharacterized protein STEHIDRAFT_124042 [Stereum hirsutum FP-91666 SS1]EIM82667.1 hypothetical protein STEHIDRAFT_124042 [Stereum hirsutum FP-91666 SS1]
MTSLSVGRSSPQPLPSLPPSPTEEDLGKRRVWDSEDGHDDAGRTENAGKGEEPTGTLGGYADGGTDEDLKKLSLERNGDALNGESYPPMTDEEAETKRVEENLRRWEIAERQRRKQARISSLASSSASTTSTLVGSPPTKTATSAAFASPEPGTTRRSSILGSIWPSRRSDAHRALSTSEELAGAVRMDDFEQRPNSPGGSRSPTPGPERRSKVADPFADPDANASSASLFVNETDGSGDGMTPLTPTQESFRQPPRPEPLDLPRPRTPPPRVYTPGVSRPPEPTRAPTMEAGGGSQTEEKPVRWWTEWLCGCREHGEEQAGRTNPLE